MNLQRSWSKVEDWIRTKNGGCGDGPEWKSEFAYSDGRKAEVHVRSYSSEGMVLNSLKLLEETRDGTFGTSISLATNGVQLSLLCDLEAGRPGQVLAPTRYEARIPGVVRKIIRDGGWKCGANPVAIESLAYRGRADGDTLAEILLHPDRALPVIVVAELGGRVLSETADTEPLPKSEGQFPTDVRLAADLAGVAIVARVDTDASFGLTSALGKELSCFNGGIRIYWPGFALDSYFRDHPLWTYGGLRDRFLSPSIADRKIRDLIRRRVFAVSTFSLQPHAAHRDVEQTELRERLHALREGRSGADLESYFEELVKEQERLELERDSALELAAQLETRALNAEAQLRYLQSGEVGNEILQEEAAPPQTVAEAVERAAAQFSETLCFGERVRVSVQDLALDAGPPEKVFFHLSMLAGLGQTSRSEQGLGADPVRWLNQRGVTTSGEGNLSRKEEQQRTLPDGLGGMRTYLLHTKPNDGTDPAHCVRIYFQLDVEAGMVLVGWVGRHL